MNLAVASGKGGTGKTTVAVNIAKVLGTKVQLLDCDVEEPNVNLFLKARVRHQEIITLPAPEIDASRCTGCGACSRFCQYHAIAAVGGKALVFGQLCHGCGGCMRVCPEGAIRETGRRIGVIEIAEDGPVTLVQGRLDVGVATVPPLIRAVRERIQYGGTAILDAPPGTSCPVVATLHGMDFVALVTEPTPFGLHDLTLAVGTVRALGLPFGVVINRAGAGDDRVNVYCEREAIPMLAEIPDDRRIAEAYSRGMLIVDALPEYRPQFAGIFEAACTLCEAAGGAPV